MKIITIPAALQTVRYRNCTSTNFRKLLFLCSTSIFIPTNIQFKYHNAQKLRNRIGRIVKLNPGEKA